MLTIPTIRLIKMGDKHNIILFGKTGVGKSTVANMLLNESLKENGNYFGISDAAVGNPADCVTGFNNEFHIFDTIGLGEPETGSIPHEEAQRRIQVFLKNIRHKFTYVCIVKKRGKLDQLDPIIFNVAKQIFDGDTRKNFVLIITDASDKWLSDERNNLIDVYGDIPMICVQFPFVSDNPAIEQIYKSKRDDDLCKLKNSLKSLNYKARTSYLTHYDDKRIAILARDISKGVQNTLRGITRFFTCVIQ